MPKHRRVLGEEARNLHDHGRHLHARLRLLQRQDRLARRARYGRAGAGRGGDSEARARQSSSRRSIATISTTAGLRISRGDPRDPSAMPGDDIEVLTPDFLRKDGAAETVVAAKPDVFNHNLETVPSQISDGAAGRALLRIDPPVAAGQGDRSGDIHQVGHHGGPG